MKFLLTVSLLLIGSNCSAFYGPPFEGIGVPNYIYLLCENGDCTKGFGIWLHDSSLGKKGVGEIVNLTNEQKLTANELAKMGHVDVLHGVYELENIPTCLYLVSSKSGVSWDSKQLTRFAPGAGESYLKLLSTPELAYHERLCRELFSLKQVNAPSLRALKLEREKWRKTPDELFQYGIKVEK